LRAENKLNSSWILTKLHREHGTQSLKILDLGCGGGLISNTLAKAGHDVIGIDEVKESLEVAKRFQKGTSAHFKQADVYHLPIRSNSMDVVCAMDLLEHVEFPGKVISEASRVLKPNGFFFFHTFNRTLLSWLLAVKGIEWIVRNTPQHLHLYRMFITPTELKEFCETYCLKIKEIVGLRPKFGSKEFWRLILTGIVPKTFEFAFTPSLKVSYLGLARKI